jgi:hypothetical protein
MTETMLNRAIDAVLQEFEGEPSFGRHEAHVAVRAVLQVIREPDDALVSVTEDLGSKSECWWLSDALQKAWPVMIDSILSPSQEGRAFLTPLSS